ncbi:MAG TPA: non-homologous end-joining DNA ligase [Dehalococcoidia bacterium]|nr:non-homologous end-joining DNA ligase [Dehalococcoidia bacterium]
MRRSSLDDTTVHATPVPKALLGRMPASISPMLAVEAAEPFDSPDHIFELMWGGVRAMAHVSDGVVRLRASNGRDLTPYFPELRAIPDRLQGREAILDGEIVAADGDGHPAFELLRPRLHAMATALHAERGQVAQLPVEFRLKKLGGTLTYVAFDILWLDGRALLDRPLWQRKNRLHQVITPSPEFSPVDFVDNEGVAFFEAVIERRLEGVVAKQKASQYTPGRRSKDWQEARAFQAGNFVIGGYAIGGTHRRGEPFSQLLMGAHTQGRFEYVGSVSGGLTDKEARDLVGLLQPLHAGASPFFDPPPLPRLIYWTRPEVVCRVRFSEWSPDGHLRFPIFSALRPDVAAEACVVSG